MNKQVLLKIHGRVQMVMFRDFICRKARKLGLAGRVRNEPDKTVSVVAEGREEELKKLIDECYNGPALARIDKIDISWQKASGKFNKFKIRY